MGWNQWKGYGVDVHDGPALVMLYSYFKHWDFFSEFIVIKTVKSKFQEDEHFLVDYCLCIFDC